MIAWIFLASLFITPFALLVLRQRFWPRGKKNKGIVITGCDSGFGLALALRLAAKDEKKIRGEEILVFATCLTSEGVERLKPHLWIRPYQVDITEQGQINDFAGKVKGHLDASSGYVELWGLVNNAGMVYAMMPDDWTTLDDYERHMNVNCYGAIRMTKAFKPEIKRSRGRILIVTSIRGVCVYPEFGPYQAAKHALEAYANGLRQEMYYFGVSVSIITPGGFKTPMALNTKPVIEKITEAWENLQDSTDYETKEQWPKTCLTSRIESIRSSDNENRSSDISPVTNALEQALFSRLPRSRYWVGNDCRYWYRPLSYLPTWLTDPIWRWQFAKNWLPPTPPPLNQNN